MAQAQGLDIEESEQALVFEEFERGDVAYGIDCSVFSVSTSDSLVFTLDDFAEDTSGCHGEIASVV